MPFPPTRQQVNEILSQITEQDLTDASHLLSLFMLLADWDILAPSLEVFQQFVAAAFYCKEKSDSPASLLRSMIESKDFRYYRNHLRRACKAIDVRQIRVPLDSFFRRLALSTSPPSSGVAPSISSTEIPRRRVRRPPPWGPDTDEDIARRRELERLAMVPEEEIAPAKFSEALPHRIRQRNPQFINISSWELESPEALLARFRGAVAEKYCRYSWEDFERFVASAIFAHRAGKDPGALFGSLVRSGKFSSYSPDQRRARDMISKSSIKQAFERCNPGVYRE
jgi:hypothetical protein